MRKQNGYERNTHYKIIKGLHFKRFIPSWKACKHSFIILSLLILLLESIVLNSKDSFYKLLLLSFYFCRKSEEKSKLLNQQKVKNLFVYSFILRAWIKPRMASKYEISCSRSLNMRIRNHKLLRNNGTKHSNMHRYIPNSQYYGTQ